jgi:hypothetical protein
MTSQLNVDTIVDKAGSGGSNVKMANTSTYVSDGGSATQNTVQGLCKAFVVYGEDTVIDAGSFNMASLTDSATGQTHQNFTNSFVGAESYTVAISCIPGTDVAERPRLSSCLAAKTITQNEEVDTSTDRDADQFHFSAHGDLA